jgi:hypothetical protein
MPSGDCLICGRGGPCYVRFLKPTRRDAIDTIGNAAPYFVCLACHDSLIDPLLIEDLLVTLIRRQLDDLRIRRRLGHCF